MRLPLKKSWKIRLLDSRRKSTLQKHLKSKTVRCDVEVRSDSLPSKHRRSKTLQHLSIKSCFVSKSTKSPSSDSFQLCLWKNSEYEIKVLKVRSLVELLYEYSRRQVDVISVAIGTVVARKAILGGSCYDKDENLGKAITHKFFVHLHLLLLTSANGFFAERLFEHCVIHNGVGILWTFLLGQSKCISCFHSS